MLRRRAEVLGVSSRVTFDPVYHDDRGLAELTARGTIVVLPYDSPDQVTSGVLVDAIGAGCPVIATDFPHAVELLASGAGIVVPRRDPAALAAAVRRALTEEGLLDSLTSEARRLAPSLSWDAVAAQYLTECGRVAHAAPSVLR
jgi:glycosyltransferase involved in cell wall biosynthesis